MLDQIWALMHVGIELIFVFDGQSRPDVRRDKKTEDPTGRKVREEDTEFFKQTLTTTHVLWRQAPGEAEAECAAVQRLGLVDAVWSEDGDTLMFGCTVVVRNLLKINGAKSKEEARVFGLSDIGQKTGISRNGLVSYAMLAGWDYTKGLYGCSTDVGRELATKQRVVNEFLMTSANADTTRWKLWRRRLEAQLGSLGLALKRLLGKEPGARDVVQEIKQKQKPEPTSTVEIDPRRLFPDIKKVLNGALTGKDADPAVVGKPIGMVESETLHAILGCRMSDEEFSQWRKGPKKTSAGNDMPTSKTQALPSKEKERRGRKRKAETSIGKPPSTLDLPRN
ncbi:hypothetical protein N0V92_005650 [Colletotrichum tropicale]|nr:hypothetical protein N0V92_005650 [Colletotrichum tropicale]